MTEKKTKFIVVAGSIMSGLGKGIVTASIAKLLSSRGYKTIPIKFDGYLNVDCGTMNPFRHGEVFVLDDGTEVDMDFGTYERFLNFSISGSCSITGGKLFQKIIEKERRGDYLGRDVQFVPHLSNEIKNWVRDIGKQNNADIVIIEVGGTIGDLENGYFLEAMRQLQFEDPMLFIQLTYIPSLFEGEQKTKPTQQATRLLQSLGIQPHIIITREQEPLSDDVKKKISLYCNVPENAVFDDPVLRTIYELPLILEKQNIYNIIADRLALDKKHEPQITEWKKLVDNIIDPKYDKLRVAIVGKYTAVKDAYISVKEALVHSAAAIDYGLEISWVEASDLEKLNNVAETLNKFDAILVPGGFGERGVEGKISAIKYARESNVPYLGLCLGLQLMVVEYARNVCKLDANSTEFNKKTSHPVIDILPEQRAITKLGGTMRLGSWECAIKQDTIAAHAYKSHQCYERHRHRYEVNPNYMEQLAKAGLIFSGVYPSKHGDIVEIAEWSSNHGFGVATQAHIELKSRLEAPAPLFVEFMKAAAANKKRKEPTLEVTKH